MYVCVCEHVIVCVVSMVSSCIWYDSIFLSILGNLWSIMKTEGLPIFKRIPLNTKHSADYYGWPSAIFRVKRSHVLSFLVLV